MTLLYCISYLLQIYIYIYIYIIYNIIYIIFVYIFCYLYILYVSDEGIKGIKEYSEILRNKYNRYTYIYIYIYNFTEIYFFSPKINKALIH